MTLTYRYTLTRETNLLEGCGEALFVMLNPSTADERKDDPTIRRCMGFARREGLAGFMVVNLFGLRATEPRVLLMADDRVGPENDLALLDAFARFREPIAAWGALHPRLWYRTRHVLTRFGNTPDRRWRCLGTTSDGHPRHPLMLRAEQRFQDFDAAAYVARLERGT